jgi:hypothetical protein
VESQLVDYCASLYEPGHNFCPGLVLMCGVDEIGHLHWMGGCNYYGPDECPLVIPCG